MANEQNLKPFTSDQSREEAKKNGKKGGIASGESRRRKRTMKEDSEFILSLALNGDDVDSLEEVQSLAELKGKAVTVQLAGIIAQAKKYIKGDKGAFELLMALSGNKPKEEVAISGSLNNPFEGLSTEELRRLIDD